jgi:hypothetical protein
MPSSRLGMPLLAFFAPSSTRHATACFVGIVVPHPSQLPTCGRLRLVIFESPVGLVASPTCKLPYFRGLGERLPGTCLLGWNHFMKRTCQLARCAPARPFILVKLSSEKLPQNSAQTKLVCAEKCANYFVCAEKCANYFSLRRKVRKLF